MKESKKALTILLYNVVGCARTVPSSKRMIETIGTPQTLCDLPLKRAWRAFVLFIGGVQEKKRDYPVLLPGIRGFMGAMVFNPFLTPTLIEASRST
jgi:hypothetical protein